MLRLLRQAEMLERAQGCLLGRLAGAALRSLVEFEIPGTDSTGYPQGVRELADGGTWNTIVGQPTDDSETALLPARIPADQGGRIPMKPEKRSSFGWTPGPSIA